MQATGKSSISPTILSRRVQLLVSPRCCWLGDCASLEIGLRAHPQVSGEGRQRIDELLAVPEDDQRSMLFHLKEYPPHGNAQTIKDYLAYYRAAILENKVKR
jgi:hypothetical protein